MAKAEQKIRIESRTVIDKVPDGVVLYLTQDEAQFVYNCAAMSSGVGPYREPSNNIFYALKPFVEEEGYRSETRGWDGHISHHVKGA